MIAGIETGGTKVVCGVADEPGTLLAVRELPTTSPPETVGRIVQTLRALAGDTPLESFGVGAFGPLDLGPRGESFGAIRRTTKPGWSGAPLLHHVRLELGLPGTIDTDVNAAALAEARWGSAVDDLAYVTVGTGVGVGLVLGGEVFHGHRGAHPEMGHLPVRRHPEDDFAGCCPLHGDCLEGLAAGPSMEQRWGLPGARDAATNAQAAVLIVTTSVSSRSP